MEQLKVFDRVKVPGAFNKGGENVTGVVTFISECAKYCKVRYSRGKKEFTKDCEVKKLTQL